MSTDDPVENLNVLFSTVGRMEREGGDLCESVRIAILRNFTIEGIEPFLKYYVLANRLRPEIAFGGYGTIAQDVLAADGLVKRVDPDVIILSLMLENVDSSYRTPRWKCDAVRNELQTMFDMIAAKARATIVVNTFLEPLHPESGLALASDRSDTIAQVRDLNEFIIEYVRERAPRFCVMDWNRYLRLLGAEQGLDTRYWYLSQAPFRRSFLNLYAKDVSRIVCALKGRTKKCVVLDCDNTLWGGVIGEDGMDGIKLDRNEYPGKAYYDFQTSLLHLAERGVLIALCSKNNEADVFDVLDNHPSCRLKRSHLSAWRINWADKMANLKALAQELNIGLDAFVFVDDNPVECGLVRQMLPEVTVLQVPQKLYAYPPLLFKDGLFDTLHITNEDRTRTRLYQSSAQRENARNEFGTVEDYLGSLDTVAVIHRARPNEYPRVAQLSQKTNQFNLTTRRYSEQEIRRLAEESDNAVYTLAVKDKFGDLGVVGVLISRRTGSTGRIDTFLMSCRALGRDLESAMIIHCLEDLRSEWGIVNWEAEYLPTRKNAQVANFWAATGFSESGNHEDRKTYRLNVPLQRSSIPTYISIQPD